MTPLAGAPRVVIAGAGPGGSAVASLLREAGAVVTVVERSVAGEVRAARSSGVVVGHEAWGLLRRVGGGGLIDDARAVVSDTERLMSLRRLDTTLAGFASAQGATYIRGHAVTGVRELGDGAKGVRVSIRNATTGVEDVLEADWFIDAAAGASPLGRDPRFARSLEQGPTRLLPVERRFLAAQTAAMPQGPMGLAGDGDVFAINDVAEGVLTAYRPIPANAHAAPTAAEGRELLAAVGVSVDAPNATWAFTARQSIAPKAADGRILLVGDSVGTVHPRTQIGTTLALMDAERAAMTILRAHGDTPLAERAAVEAYDLETVSVHRAFLR